MEDKIFCNFDAAKWMFFSDHVPSLVYYTHFFSLFATGIIVLFILTNGKKSLERRVLFLSLIPFWLWIGFNIVIWASNNSRLITILWSLQILLEPMTYAGMYYLVYLLLKKQDFSLIKKYTSILFLFPLVISTILNKNIVGFDFDLCIPIENPYSYYTYIIETIFIFLISALCFSEYRNAKSLQRKHEIFFIGFGVIFFLLSFVSGNIIGSLTGDWNTAQAGLFGVPVFLVFLTYSIIQYNAFSIKLLRAQALVVSMIILIASQFFFIRNPINRVLTAVTLALVSVFGWWLVVSVKKENEQRETVEKANEELKKLDAAKTEFINIASHQLRTPISVIQGVASMMMEGDIDRMPPEQRQKFYRSVWEKTKKLKNIVHDILNATNFADRKFSVTEQSTELIDVAALATKVVSDFESEVKERDLDLSIVCEEGIPRVRGQADYLEEALINIVNNAIKYTPSSKTTPDIRAVRKGSERAFVAVTVGKDTRDATRVLVAVRDNGIGIPSQAKEKLFHRFSRAQNAVDMYTDGTGLGLFIVREIVEGHGGRVWFESEVDCGTTFFVSLPSDFSGSVDMQRYIAENTANVSLIL
jgi:signal transduction histidine kinase